MNLKFNFFYENNKSFKKFFNILYNFINFFNLFFYFNFLDLEDSDVFNRANYLNSSFFLLL